MPGVEVIYRFSSSGALYKNEIGNSRAIQKEMNQVFRCVNFVSGNL